MPARKQYRAEDFDEFHKVMHKADGLARNILGETARRPIPRNRIYQAVISAMAGAHRLGVQRGIHLMKGDF